MNDFSEVERAMTEMSNAAGSSDQEMEIIKDSIDYKLNALKESWVGFLQDALSREDTKELFDALIDGSKSLQQSLTTITPALTAFIKVLTQLLEVVAKVNSATGGLAGLAGLIYGGAKVKGKVNDVRGVMGGLLGTNKTNKKSILSGGLSGLIDFLKKPAFSKAAGEVGEEVGEQITKNVVSSISKSQAGEMISEALLASFQDGIDASTYATMQFGVSLEELQAIEAGTVIQTQAVGTSAATASISLGALLGIIAAVGVAIYAGYKAWDNYNVTVEEVQKNIDNISGKIEKLKSELKELEESDHRTTATENRISLLKQEISLQEQSLRLEKEKRKAELLGTGFTDLFDEDNLRTRLWNNEGGQANSPGAQMKLINDSIDKYKNYQVAIQDLNRQIATESDKFIRQELISMRDSYLEESIKLANSDIPNRIVKLEERAIEAKDIALAYEELDETDNEYYKQALDDYNTYMNSIINAKKEIGTYNLFEDGYIDKNGEYSLLSDIKNYDEEKLKELINSEKTQFEIVKDIEKEYPELSKVLRDNGYTVIDLVHYYNQLEDAEKGASSVDFKSSPLSTSETIDELSKLESQIGTVDSAFAELFNPDDMEVDLSSIKSIKDAFKEINENYDFSKIENDLENLYNATTSEEAQESVNNLVAAFLEESAIKKGLDESNRDLIQSELERLGIANAEQIVAELLTGELSKQAAEKEYLAATGVDVVNATAQEITSFINESDASDITKQHLAQLALQKIDLNNTKILTSDECNNLLHLVQVAGYTGEQLSILTSLINTLNSALNGTEIVSNERVKNIRARINEILSEQPDIKDIEIPDVVFDGGKATKDAKDSAAKASSAAKDSAETFDWLETKIQRCEEEIQRLDKTVSATYKGWSKRNSAIASELDKIREKIQLQMTAYDVYMKKANSIGLSDTYKQLVMHGGLKIEEISDENLKKQINDFKTFYEKAIAAKDAIEDLNAQLTQLAKQKFENVKSEFEGFTSEIEHFVNMIDKELSHVENMEKIAGKSFYTAKMDQDEQRLEELNKERTALLQALREAEANGIEEGSADWIAMRNDIYSVDEAIADLTYEVEDLKKKMKEVAKLNFDDLKSQFENAISIITGQIDLTDAVVSMTQNAGYIASREYYKALIEGSKENVTGLRKEYETLSKTLADAMAAGDIEKYDKQWYEMNSDIMDVKKNLVDAANATIEYANALRQIDWDVFDRGLDRIKLLVDESEFFQELMSWDDKLKDDNGDWTNKGLVKQGLIAQDYQSYMDSANAYGAEAEEIRKLLETDPKNTVLIDRMHELLGLQRESILSALKMKKSLVDLIKEGYDELLKRIKKLIDEYKEALDAAKD